MSWGFNSVDNGRKTVAVSVDALRGQAMQRLAGIEHSLESKGINAAFSRAAKGDGFLGSIAVDMIMMTPISACVSAHFQGAQGAAVAFNHVSAVMSAEGIAEGLVLLRDQKSYGYYGRRLSDYPEGRRKCALEAARIARKFNLVSANQNNRLSYDAEADMACMFEILDMLDRLQQEGVTAMRLDEKKPVYDVLKQTTEKMSPKNALRSFAMPLMKTV